jgi:hypothetical protein
VAPGEAVISAAMVGEDFVGEAVVFFEFGDVDGGSECRRLSRADSAVLQARVLPQGCRAVRGTHEGGYRWVRRRVGEAWPNNIFGFGQVNLAHLPVRNSGRMIVAEAVKIGDRQHLVGMCKVTEKSALRITIAWTDAPLAAESFVPLCADLDLIVKTPSGQVIIGNSHVMEERFWTIERVIVDAPILGDYEIHVIAAIQNGGSAVFAAVVIGGIVVNAQAKLEFQSATSCVGTCHLGKCTEDQICDCSSTDTFGQFCQHPVDSLGLTNVKKISVGGVDLNYFKVTKPDDIDQIEVVIKASGPEDVVIPLRCFYHEGMVARGIPFEYSVATWQNGTDRGTLKISTKADVLSILVKNDMSQSVAFAI